MAEATVADAERRLVQSEERAARRAEEAAQKEAAARAAAEKRALAEALEARMMLQTKQAQERKRHQPNRANTDR